MTSRGLGVGFKPRVNKKMNETIEKVRYFLHQENPSQPECDAIFRTLERALEHQALWLPMFQAHARWAREPLIWSHVDDMDGGALPSEVYGPWSVEMEAYEQVFPGAPIKLLLRGGHSSRIGNVTAPGACVRRCVHLCIDHPEWSIDAGQDGQYSGSANILEILDAAQRSLRGQLRALHTFTFEAARHSRYQSTDADEDRYCVQTTLLPRTLQKRDRGFDRLKKLLAGRSQLRHLTLSNKSELSDYNRRTGKSRPYCLWLPRCSWWPLLESLDLHENKLQDADMSWLFSAEMPALVELSLRDNRLTDQGVGVLLREGSFPSLERLDLRGNALSAAGAQALRESPHLPRLKSLLVEESSA